MRTIWKYPLATDSSRQRVDMPANAFILAAGMQNRTVTLWAMVYDDLETRPRYFQIFETGQDLGASRRKAYLGTVKLPPHMHILHIFEVEVAHFPRVDHP